VPYVLWLDRVLVNPRDGAWHFGAMLIGREPYDIQEVWHHLRAWAVKGFFCAFMISILPGGFQAIVSLNLAEVPFGPVPIAGWLTELLFLVDVQIAMVGYLLTLKPLDAQIRTANPWLGGWLAALICYPPFILMGDGGPLSYHQNTADWAVLDAGARCAAVGLGGAAGVPDRRLCLGDGRLRHPLFEPDLSRRADQWALPLHAAPGLSFEEPVLVVLDAAVLRHHRFADRHGAQHHDPRDRQRGLFLARPDRGKALAGRRCQVPRLSCMDGAKRADHARCCARLGKSGNVTAASHPAR
jgi:hypothetical protein